MYDSLGLEKTPKYQSIDSELCRVVMSKRYLLVDLSRVDSICFASPLIFLPGLEGPQRKWKGLVFLNPVNTDIPKMICLKFPWHCREVTPKHPTCTLNIFCLGKKRERHHWWQWIQFQALPWCPGVRYGIRALPVIRQHLVESWDSFFSSAFPGRNVGLDIALDPFFSIQAASQGYLSRLRVTEWLVYLLQWALLSPQRSGITFWVVTWAAAMLLNIG